MSSYQLAEARSEDELFAAREFLSQELISNAQLNDFVAQRLEGNAHNPRLLMACKEGEPVAIATLGPFIHVTEGPHRAVGALGREMANRSFAARLLAGTPEAVGDFVSGYNERRALPPVELELERDIFVLRHPPKHELAKGLTLRHATLDDLDFIIVGVTGLVMDEFGYDPGKRENFRERIISQINANAWWIGEDSERRFICQQGVSCEMTCRIHNLWVPQNSRGGGYATRFLRLLASELLKTHRTISLSVNRINQAAKHVYLNVGFDIHSAERMLVFHREDAAETLNT
jgi:hypothetical protein